MVTGKTTATLGSHAATVDRHPAGVYGLAFSPNGRYLATANADHTARLWDVTTGNAIATFTGHTDVVEGVALSPDGGTLATAGADGTLRLRNIPTGPGR